MNRKFVLIGILVICSLAVLSAETIVSGGVGYNLNAVTSDNAGFEVKNRVSSPCITVSFFTGEEFGLLANASVGMPGELEVESSSGTSTYDLDSGLYIDAMVGLGVFRPVTSTLALIAGAGVHVFKADMEVSGGGDYSWTTAGVGLDAQLLLKIASNVFIKAGAGINYDFVLLSTDSTYLEDYFNGAASIVPSVGVGLLL